MLSPLSLLRHLTLLLLPLSIAGTTWLYLYPLIHHCAFPAPSGSSFTSTLFSHLGYPDAQKHHAPFRLLALGDPQLEGNTALPNPNDPYFPAIWKRYNDFVTAPDLSKRISIAYDALREVVLKDIPHKLETPRKKLDLLGNDYYLAHIYRTLRWWAKPTHVSVLGDLLGSQWIDDAEFARRSDRYWNRVFEGGKRVEDRISSPYWDGTYRTESLGADPEWSSRVINIAGNHDIGYAGDITPERMDRFDAAFGPANWEINFTLNTTITSNEGDKQPTIRLLILNTLNLDTPARTPSLQEETYDFLNAFVERSAPVDAPHVFTLVLTHLPLHKDAGICTDAPYFNFHDGGVREQNHLSEDLSVRGMLAGVYGMGHPAGRPDGGRGRPGVIVNGHDHTGCDVWHYLAYSTRPGHDPASEGGKFEKWRAFRLQQETKKKNGMTPRPVPGIREVTLRAMMGDYGGSAGLLSVWWDSVSSSWQYGFDTCALGTQHWWWAVHIIDLITIAAMSILALGKALGLDSGATNEIVKKGEVMNGHPAPAESTLSEKEREALERLMGKPVLDRGPGHRRTRSEQAKMEAMRERKKQQMM